MIKELSLHFYHRFTLSLLELLAFFPIVIIMYIVLFPPINLSLFVVLLCLSSLVGIIAGRIAIFSKRNLILLVGLALIVYSAFNIHGQSFMWLFHAIAYGFLYIRGFKSSETLSSEWFPVQIFFVSYLLHFIVIFYFSRVYEFMHYLPYLAWSAFLTIVASMIFMNYKQLNYASLSYSSDFSPPKDMIKKNFVMVALVLLLVFSVSYFREIRESLIWFWNAIVNSIASIIAYLSALFQNDDPHQALPVQESFLPPALEATLREQNPIWLAIIEVISTIFLILIVLTITFLFLKAFYLLIRALIKSIFSIMKNESSDNTDEESGFEDQKENLFDLDKLKENYLNRMRAIMAAFLTREKKWQDLTSNTEKIRFLYKYIVTKYVASGYKFKPDFTPVEFAKDAAVWRKLESNDLDELSALYSEARYGNKNAEDNVVNSMKEKIIDRQTL